MNLTTPILRSRIRRSRCIAAIVSVAAIVAISACHKGAPKDILTNGKKLYSQFNEELIIRHFFDDRRGGFFVDVGAWDWREGSTTNYLENHLDWSGIAIDAQADLRAGYEQNRKRTKFFNYIVTDHSGAKEKLYLAGQISSIDPTHIDQFPLAKGAKLNAIELETITLNDLLDKEGVKHIDFLSMDIEGAEPAALSAFDIERFKPKLVCIETAPKTKDQIEKYFTEHGYQRIDEYVAYDAVNWYFKPRG